MWDLPPPDPAIEIVVASRGMSKGIAQTKGAQVVPKAFVQFGPVQVGGQWKNVSSAVADGEAAAFVNYTPKLGPYQLTLGAAYKFQAGVEGDTDDESFEFTTAVSRKRDSSVLLTWPASVRFPPVSAAIESQGPIESTSLVSPAI